MKTEHKKHQVVMLPAKGQAYQIKEGQVFINDTREYSWGSLEALRCNRVTAHGHAWVGQGIKTNINHLYILSDEEPKEGDWCYDSDIKTVFKNTNRINDEITFKVIATTDTSLKFREYTEEEKDKAHNNKLSNIWLYKTPQDFIEYFTKEYNKGNIITEVNVEYEYYKKNGMFDEASSKRLKISKDNTISILLVKTSWSREEVEELARQYKKDCEMYSNTDFRKKYGDKLTYPEMEDQWFKENL